MLDSILPLFSDPAAWAALVTLIVMEVVLGIDNLIFISILSNKLPPEHRQRTRRIGIGLALLAYPAYLGYQAYKLPMINDITTDPIDPPRFDVLARLRPRGTVEYAGLYAAELQRKAYPDIEPLSVSAAPKAAYDATMAIIQRRKWRVVVDRPPQPNRRDGVIEAVARTAMPSMPPWAPVASTAPVSASRQLGTSSARTKRGAPVPT